VAGEEDASSATAAPAKPNRVPPAARPPTIPDDLQWNFQTLNKDTIAEYEKEHDGYEVKRDIKAVGEKGAVAIFRCTTCKQKDVEWRGAKPNGNDGEVWIVSCLRKHSCKP